MTSLPGSPYKGLAAFDDSELDALLFFGREPEIEAVVANVLASRLTVLYGPSGVGKSSLLRAGVARRLRERSGAPVVVHDAWADDPAGGLISSVREECAEVGATAGLVDTVAAATARTGELYLLLDQFEEYLLYHGSDGPLSAALPELLRRPGLRVNVLLALRDDALAELDEFAARIPELFANLLRLDRLDRAEGRAAILGPLERYSELSGTTFTAEDALVDAVLDEASTATGVEAPYLQLVLERLWEQERSVGSQTLRLATFRQIGGSRAVVDEHVRSALEQLAPPEQEAATRVVRQLVTPSGRKLSHEADDLAAYASVEPTELRELLEELGRRRIVRRVDGTPGAGARYEIFHDVLGPPLLAWQQEHELRDERERAARQRRRLRIIAGASLAGLVLVALLAVFALIQRSNAQTQARQARGRALAARALAAVNENPQTSVALALRAAKLAPSDATASVLRTSLGAMREKRVFRLRGKIVAASFEPGGALLLASSNGRLDTYDMGVLHKVLPPGPELTTATWSVGGERFAAGARNGTVKLWGQGIPAGSAFHMPSAITSLDFEKDSLLIGSGTALRLANLENGKSKTFRFAGPVAAAAMTRGGGEVAVAFEHGKSTAAEVIDTQTGRLIRRLPEEGIRSFAFSPNEKLLATGSYDRTARLWDARTGRLLHVLPHVGYVLQESFSRDGSQLVTASSDGAAYVWDVATGQRRLLLVGPTGAVESATFSPSGGDIATASADRLARIYNANNGELVAPLSGSANAVTSVAFDPSGRTLVTASSDGTARLWDAQPLGTLITIDKETSPVHSFWLGANPVTVAGRVAHERSRIGRVLHTTRMNAPIIAAASRGDHFALLDEAGQVTTSWDGSLALSPDFHVSAIAFARDGSLLTGQTNGVVMKGGNVVGKARGPVLEIEAADDRFIVRTATEVRVYTDGGTLVSTIHTAADHATLSPDGRGVATSTGSVAGLWDATTGKLRHTLRGHRSGITALAYSPDSLELATGSYDHTGVVWSARSGKLLHRLIGHFFAVYDVGWSADGSWIVTASQYTAGLWNASTGQLMFYVGRHGAPLTGATFSPTGDWILTGSNDGTARVLNCQVCEPLGQLERLAALRLRRLAR